MTRLLLLVLLAASGLNAQGIAAARPAAVRSCGSLRVVTVAAYEIGIPDRQTRAEGMKR